MEVAGLAALTGATPILSTAQVLALGPGSHTVQLTVTDSFGLTATASTTLSVDTQELFVANYQGSTVTVYARTANGNLAPLRSIAGAATGLGQPTGLAFDPNDDEIIVANEIGSSITVYARTAGGNMAPVRTIQGPQTGLQVPTGVTLDLVHDEILVVSRGDDSVGYFRGPRKAMLPRFG